MSSNGDVVKNKTVQLSMDMPVGKIPFNSYPRPIMVRDTKWVNLNGKWDCGVTVPFPLQSVLSGFKGEVPEEYTYFTSFEYYPSWEKRTLLHFGAVDQICEVMVDGHPVGTHKGGYLPFSFDITDALDNSEMHKLTVKVTDTLSEVYPHGKQSNKRGGMWYTPVTGIWQTVWLEEVPRNYIKGFRVTPSLDSIKVVIDGDFDEYYVEITEPTIGGPVDRGDRRVIHREKVIGNKTHIEIDDVKNWTTDDPWLYGIRIIADGDTVLGYFALRTITIKKINGLKRICLNDKEIFLHAVLDQGYYPEGIYLPNNEQGYENDILAMKELGFNALRKHIKIEPQCFYYACDRLGMLVMQDMVNNSDYDFMRDTILPTFGIKYKPDHLYHRNEETRAVFEQHMKETVHYLYNFPSIVYYTIFNEGWGQFCADKMYEELTAIDNTRIVDATSGWFRQLKSDVESIHAYFHRVVQLHHKKPIIISEFGGYSLIVKEHIFNPHGNYGYKNFTEKKALSKGLLKLYEQDVISYQKKGLCGSVYTQLSDVEDETNGLYTYDRKICKVDKKVMRLIAKLINDEIGRVEEVK